MTDTEPHGKYGSLGTENYFLDMPDFRANPKSSPTILKHGSASTSSIITARNEGRKNIADPRSKKLTIGLIGAGYWGVRHLRTLNILKNVVNLNACLVWDLDTKRKFCSLNEFELCLPASSIEHCLESSDAVIVATPAATHYDIARKAIERGIPTLVEKPLCDTLSKAKELYALAFNNNCYLQVGHQYNFNQLAMFASELIRERLGENHLQVSSIRTGGIIRNDVDILQDLAIHDLTVAGLIFSENPSGISISDFHIGDSGQADAICFTLCYSSGGRMDVVSSWSGPRRRMLRASSDHGIVTFDETVPPERQLQMFSAMGGHLSFENTFISPLEAQAYVFLDRSLSSKYNLRQAKRDFSVLEMVSQIQSVLYSDAPRPRGTFQ